MNNIYMFIKKVWRYAIDSIVPIVIVCITIIICTFPEIAGIVIDKNSMTLVLLSLLAVDAVLDKYKTKQNISDRIKEIEKQTISVKEDVGYIKEEMNEANEYEVLKRRSDFDRLENIFVLVKKELFVSGINLDAILPLCDIIKALVKNHVKVRLLVLDPKGKTLSAASGMSGVQVSVRKRKIMANIESLQQSLGEELKQGFVELKTIDSVLPCSFIGIDMAEDNGRLIVQNYLYQVPSSKSLMLDFTKRQEFWYNLYYDQIELIWANSKEYKVEGEV